MAKKFLVDLTRCTACRGCQVACKQWKKLPAEATVNWGSHQNPRDLSFNTLRLVRFEEVVNDGKVDWLFFPEQCRHCYEPPCMGQAELDDERAVVQDEETGAVIFTEYTRNVDAEGVRESCPYDIPRKDPATGQLSKCDMCIDRIQNGMKPSCVLSCPTGAMTFGEEEEIDALAKERLAAAQKRYPEAVLGDPDDVRVVYLFQQDPTKYFEKAIAAASPNMMNRKQMFARLLGTTKA
ncbi:4Fe-4S dicluster domain-containing protein [Halodesulfovibrio sp. MK-HDV]|jgi:formate dehydrogenase iron-sulfur subunit|uniref:4Fe-4S dicluster domain-containing protein n=1 Tax=Halodesulfovibrio sp. MK-HDV TaxID=2599925 RepID=UPI0013701D0E|nr:4Fe-4S dicluster domain-containing protein [Halodesulfovibrio sp. MK-HDV]KAF1075351.1 Formate dehydrogenase subunit beta [Halodesulfovibrio sp. MK-HDV]